MNITIIEQQILAATDSLTNVANQLGQARVPDWLGPAATTADNQLDQLQTDVWSLSGLGTDASAKASEVRTQLINELAWRLLSGIPTF